MPALDKKFTAEQIDAILAREAKRLLQSEREDWFACLDDRDVTVEVRRAARTGAVVRFLVRESVQEEMEVEA